ncbi:MAG: hypothetical protein M3Y72_22070 [Acidobacteriota bacterium]|nr:hypothetical protein [Acidobacteriota bacterium]
MWFFPLRRFCALRRVAANPAAQLLKAEAAGSGTLSGVSSGGMKQWLGQHKDVAYQIDEMCKPVRIKATARWTESTEGRLCSAARELAFFRSGPVKNSGKTYWPGK